MFLAEDESYDYAYEQQFQPAQKTSNNNNNNSSNKSNNRNLYDQAEFSAVQGRFFKQNNAKNNWLNNFSV